MFFVKCENSIIFKTLKKAVIVIFSKLFSKFSIFPIFPKKNSTVSFSFINCHHFSSNFISLLDFFSQNLTQLSHFCTLFSLKLTMNFFSISKKFLFHFRFKNLTSFLFFYYFNALSHIFSSLCPMISLLIKKNKKNKMRN